MRLFSAFPVTKRSLLKDKEQLLILQFGKELHFFSGHGKILGGSEPSLNSIKIVFHL